jgi:aryl-alcohol dehydrogenase-like predicted oxidoreductase
MMQKKQLGQTPLFISPLGLGTVKFGRTQALKYPKPFERPTDHQISTLLNHAQEQGINLLDTASAYGTSETRIGHCLTRTARKDWVIMTKGGEFFEHGQSHYDFSVKAMDHSLVNSLKNLKTDFLDIFLIHSDGRDLEIAQNDALWQLLAHRQQQGDIRSYGVSTKTITGGLDCLERSDLLMITYRADYTDEKVILEAAQKHQKGIILKKLLNSGQITNDDDIVSAFGFSFSHPAVTSAVIGTLNIQHLDHNIKALAHALSKPLLLRREEGS